MIHVPVLLKEVIEGLNLEKGKTIIDGTLNGGGHAREIIKKIMPGGKFLGIDLDGQILKSTEKELSDEFSDFRGSLEFAQGNYKDTVEIAGQKNISKADGILLDLGFSSFHVDVSQRGFTFQKDEMLDMRYDNSTGHPAYELVNGMDEKSLADIIWKFGEERFSRQIAKAIVTARRKEKIKTTGQLAEIIKMSVPGFYRRGKLNPATKTFQALRICVNDELGNLQRFLDTMISITNYGARIAIISFHSLEDRIVKNYFNNLKKEGTAKVITKKPITATREESEQNPRSRSAKLRILEII